MKRRSYSEEDIAEFLRFIDYDSIKGMLNSGDLMMWACFEGDCVCGVLAVRPPGHISLMFVDSRSHHKGIARALFEYTLAQLHITEERITMTVNSSPYAVGFYQKMGFKETDSEQTVNGIRFIPMKRPV